MEIEVQDRLQCRCGLRFKIDGIVWKLDIYNEVQPQTEKALK